MRALTVKQPWAACLASGVKRIENRKWRPTFRGPLLVHAGLTADPIGGPTGWLTRYRDQFGPYVLNLGCIIALATLSGIHRAGPECGPACDPWGQPDVWHWEIGYATPLDNPIPAVGRLGLWKPDNKLIHAAYAQTRQWCND